MSLTVLRAASGSGAPRQPSALMTSVPPPSMRQPPALVSAVDVERERRRCADGGLVELNVADGIVGGVGKRRAQATIGTDDERAAAFDAPATGIGVGG